MVRADSAESTDTTTTTTTTASTGRTTNSRASSHTFVSSSTASKANRKRVSIADLRSHAQAATQGSHGVPITIENGDQLAKMTSATLSLASNGVGSGIGEPDFGSDDSDGPPSEEGEETE